MKKKYNNSILIKILITALLWIIVVSQDKLSGDTARRLRMTHAWVTGQPEISLPQNYRPQSRLDGEIVGVLGTEGKRYIVDDLGQSILMFPGDWLGTQLHHFFPQQDSKSFREIIVNLTIFIPLHLATIFSCYLLLRVFNFSSQIAGLATIIFLLCTTFLSYVQNNQQNHQVLLFVTLGYATALIAIKTQKVGFFLSSGLVLGMALFIRSTSIIHVLCFLLFFIGCTVYQTNKKLNVIKNLGFWLLGFLPILLLIRLINYFRYGSFWITGQKLYIDQINIDPIFNGLPYIDANFPFDKPFYEGIIGVLFTPAKSIFIYDPLLLPCLILGIIFWKTFSPYVKWYLISIFIENILFIIALAKLNFWHGDAAWGARYHVTSVHLLLIILITILLEKILLKPSKKFYKALTIFIITIAFLLQLISVFFRPSLESKQISFAPLETFFEFRVITRINNIACWITRADTEECRYKLDVKNEKNLDSRLTFIPFMSIKNKKIALIFKIILLIVALTTTWIFWVMPTKLSSFF